MTHYRRWNTWYKPSRWNFYCEKTGKWFMFHGRETTCPHCGDLVTVDGCLPYHRYKEKIDRCGYCGQAFNLETLRDQASVEEWKISGMCQACQDVVFQEAKH